MANRLASEVDVDELMSEIRRGRGPVVGKPFMRDPVTRSVAFMESEGCAWEADLWRGLVGRGARTRKTR